MKKTVILITGPTASGKTSLAVAAAKHFGTEIISADSRQCYREMNIGVAKPSIDDLEAVPHHFVNSHSIHDDVNAATFAQYADEAASTIFSDHDVLILTGGTGLYIKAFLEGLDDIPAIDASIRQSIIQQYHDNGIAWLQEKIKHEDKRFYAEGEIHNPQRLMRALEVKRSTGKSIIDFRNTKSSVAASAKFDVEKYAIAVPRERLYENINNRVDTMIEDGLVEEALQLQPYRHLNALQTVGYTELFDHFDGKYSLEQSIEKIKQNTRNYAKRQMTWFRKEKDLQWIINLEELLELHAKRHQ